MALYIVFRLASAVPVLLIVTLISFMIMQLVPGDAGTILAGLDATDAEIEEINRRLGVDRPALVQLKEWYVFLAHGDLGKSFQSGESVTISYLKRLPVTLSLALFALIFLLIVAIPVGAIAAIHHNTTIDHALMTLAVLGLSIPNFWLGLMLIVLFAVNLGWLPSGGYIPPSESVIGWIRGLILPAFSLGVLQMGLLARITRSSMLDVLGQDYIRTARAKGLPGLMVYGKHALKNTLIPVTTVVGLSVGSLIGGAVVIETVYTIPGVGRLLVGAVSARDYPIIQGGLLLSATLLVFISFVVDIVYAFIDPRVRYDS